MNRLRVCIFLLLSAIALCGCQKEFVPDAKMCFYQDVCDLSDNIRNIGVSDSDDNQIYISVYVYAEFFEYDYEDFSDSVVEIASDYNLSDNGGYKVTVYDLNTYLHDINSIDDPRSPRYYFGEFSKEYD